MNLLQQYEIEGKVEFTRQKDWYDPTVGDDHVTMVGVGGIGSPTAFALAKLGIPNLTFIDPDTVEAHNLPNQVFETDGVSHAKVSVLAASLGAFMPTTNFTLYGAKIEDSGWIVSEATEGEVGNEVPERLNGIVISGLDSMEARSNLWHQAVKFKLGIPLYLDARLDQENIVIYAVNPLNMEEIEGYEKTLYSDEDAKETSCTRQSIMDVGFAVAALLTRAVRRHLAEEEVERVTYYDHQRLRFMTGGYS